MTQLVALAISTSAVSPSPKTDPATWFSETDYPAAALAKKAVGSISVELSVGPSGVPSACKVIVPAREPSLNQATCSILMSRARFQPQASSSSPRLHQKYSQTVQWRIPASPSTSYGGIYADFKFDRDGAVVNCRERAFGLNDLTLEACDLFEDSTKEELQKVFGKAVEGAVQGTLWLEIIELEKGVVPVSLPALHLAYFVLMKVSFDLLPSGKIENCKVLTSFSDKLPNPCEELKQTPPKPSGSSVTAQLGFTFDFWLDGAELPVVKEVS